MTSLLHLSEKRSRQLEQEIKFDQKLTELSKQCPQTVLEFLFKIRSINRTYSNKVYNSSVFNYVDNINNSLNIQDNILELSLTCSSIQILQLST